MNTNYHLLRRQLKRLLLLAGTPLLTVTAIGGAFLVETEHLDYAYPLELVLKGLVNDSVMLTISTK